MIDELIKPVQALVDARNELLKKVGTIDAAIAVLTGSPTPTKSARSRAVSVTEKKERGRSPITNSVVALMEDGEIRHRDDIFLALGATQDPKRAQVKNVLSYLVKTKEMLFYGEGRYRKSDTFSPKKPRTSKTYGVAAKIREAMKPDVEYNADSMYSEVKPLIDEAYPDKTPDTWQIKGRVSSHLANLAIQGKIRRVREGVYAL